MPLQLLTNPFHSHGELLAGGVGTKSLLDFCHLALEALALGMIDVNGMLGHRIHDYFEHTLISVGRRQIQVSLYRDQRHGASILLNLSAAASGDVRRNGS